METTDTKQSTHAQRDPDSAVPVLRHIGSAELQDILKAHLLWLSSDGEQGQLANLERTDLSGRDMHGVNLQHARLAHANMRATDLSHSDLSHADLQAVDLCCAKLQQCKLTKASGLSSTLFSAADLADVQLSEPLAQFSKTQHINEASNIARPIFLFMLVTCLFAVFTILSTGDTALVMNTPSAVLPNLNTQIPAASFFYVAPLILFGLYIYLHFYLLVIWETLAELPARFPDGIPLAQKVSPWLLVGLLPYLQQPDRRQRSRLVQLKYLVVIFLVWWAVPLSLLLFWFRYLSRHDWLGTGLHILLTLVACWSASRLYRLAVELLRPQQTTSPLSARWITARRFTLLASTILVFSAIVFYKPLVFAFWSGNPKPKHVTWFVANIPEARLTEQFAELSDIDGANLRRVDLRFAFADRAVLARADLRKADLSRADFYAADFRGANLEKTWLNGANLDTANFSSACLRKAMLQKADLKDAIFEHAYLGIAQLSNSRLKRANFRHAHLHGTDLSQTDLSGADFSYAEFPCWRGEQCASLAGAKLQDTLFKGTILIHTDLSTATHLTQAQVDQTFCDESTQLPQGLSLATCLANSQQKFGEAPMEPTDTDISSNFHMCSQEIMEDRWQPPGEYQKR